MANINLLPWREARRQERKKQFLIGLGATLAGAAMSVLLWDLAVNSQIDYQQSRNQYLRTQMTLRLEQLQGRVDKDRALIMELAQWEERRLALGALGAGGAAAAAELRWWLEEYRVSLTAQKLGTVAPISAKRLKARFEAAEASARLGEG